MILTKLVNPLLITTVLMASAAFAQEGSHTESKYVLNGLDPVALSKGKSERGDQRWRADFEGYTYLFSSQENRSDFKDSPKRYAVQDHGHCPVAKVMMNREMKGKPEIFSVYRSKVYLLANADAKEAFEGNPAKFVDAQSGNQRSREGSGRTREGSGY